MITKRGRGAVRIAPGDPEYWIASSNPELDQPLRHAALARDRRGPVEGARAAVRPRPGSERQRQPQGAELMTVTVPSERRDAGPS